MKLKILEQESMQYHKGTRYSIMWGTNKAIYNVSSFDIEGFNVQI